MQILYWRSNDGTYDAKRELDDICMTYRDCNGAFRNWVKSQARLAARGRLSAHRFSIREFSLWLVEHFGGERYEELAKQMRSQSPADADVTIHEKSWELTKNAWNNNPPLNQAVMVLKSVAALSPPCQEYTTVKPFVCLSGSVPLLFESNFLVERANPTRVKFFRFDVTSV